MFQIDVGSRRSSGSGMSFVCVVRIFCAELKGTCINAWGKSENVVRADVEEIFHQDEC